jgi:hypothetical protein
MPLTNNTLPSIPPEWIVPLDANMQFCSAQNLVASGFLTNVNTFLDVGPGRFEGHLALDITVMDLSSVDETYRFFLLGSNDSAFGNGNCDILCCRDFAAATAGRLIPTLVAPTSAVPSTGRAGSLIVLPFTNFIQGFVFRYLKLDVIIGGTTPSVTTTAWVAPQEIVQG